MSRIKHFDYSRGSAHVPADPRGGSGPCSSARDHGMNQKTKQKSREAIAASAAALLTNYQDASHMAELEPTFRQGADTWAKHLVTSAAGRAATFGMILIVQRSR